MLITPPGGTQTDYTKYFNYSADNWQTMINQQFGRQGDTASITLTDEHPDGMYHFIIQPMSEIIINDLVGGGYVFAGVINDPQWIFEAPNLSTWYLNCVDFTVYANTAVLYNSYSGLPMDDVVVDVVNSANCGLHAAKVADGGFVAPGPIIPFMTFQWQTLTQAFQQISQYASQAAQYGWYVDNNKEVHFYNQFQSEPTGVIITDKIQGFGEGPSATIARMEWDPMFAYEWDGTSLYNQVYVIGSDISIPMELTGPPVAVYTGDGNTNMFPLPEPILQEQSSATYIGTDAFLLVNLQPYEVGLAEVEQQNQLETTEWQLTQTPGGVWYLTNVTGPPAAGTVIQLWYSYVLPVIGVATNATTVAEVGHTYCVDEQTEILTRQGWKTFDAVQEGEDVLTMNPLTETMEWQPCDHLNIFDWNGDLVKWDSTRMDALTTPDHRWITRDWRLLDHRYRHRATNQWRATSDLAITTRVVVGGGNADAVFAEYPKLDDEIVETIGWIITEGAYDSRPGKNAISIKQSITANPQHVQSIRRLIQWWQERGATFTEHKRVYENGCVAWYLGNGVASYMRELIPNKQLSPELLCTLTRSQAELLLNVLMDGDGHTKKQWGCRSWTQKDRCRNNSFQMLTSMLGLQTHQRPRSDDCVDTFIYQHQDVIGHSIVATTQHYEGKVWCPTTANGTWMARRNGVTYWTGNSEVITDNTLLTEQSCFARAQRELTEYSRVEERLNCYLTQDFAGVIHAGDVIEVDSELIPNSLNNYLPGLQGTFIVLSNTIMLLSTGYRQFQLQAMRIATS